MTVQVDSQPVTDQIMWCIDMCCINNTISCLEKKTTLGTKDQTCYVKLCVCLLRLAISTARTYWCTPDSCSLSCALKQNFNEIEPISQKSNNCFHCKYVIFVLFSIFNLFQYLF